MNPLLLRLVWVGFYLLVAGVLARVLPLLVPPLVVSRARMRRRQPLSDRRINTINHLTRDLVVGFVVVIFAVLILSLFVESTGLLTFLGLFSAAFGLGARPLVSDYLSGVIFLFEDQYTIGEKVEIFGIEGTVEDITLRTTLLRAPSGELHIIPNGEVRAVRNFARGTFSLGTIHIDVKSTQLEQVSALLNQTVVRAAEEIPDLIAPPEIISQDGLIGATTRITLVARARYGKGALVRRQLLEYVNDAISKHDLEVAG